MSAIDWELAADLLAWSERLEETVITFEDFQKESAKMKLTCPECGEEVWDGPKGSKLAKCWNSEGHSSGLTLAFDTMEEEEDEEVQVGA